MVLFIIIVKTKLFVNNHFKSCSILLSSCNKFNNISILAGYYVVIYFNSLNSIFHILFTQTKPPRTFLQFKVFIVCKQLNQSNLFNNFSPLFYQTSQMLSWYYKRNVDTCHTSSCCRNVNFYCL